MKNTLLTSGLVVVLGALPALLSAAPEPIEHEWRFEGIIGDKLPVTLLLREIWDDENGMHLDGSYYYHRTGMPIDLSVSEPEYQQLVCEEISGYDTEGEALVTGVLDLRFNEERTALTGEWRAPNGKKTLPVTLKESYSDGSVRVVVHTVESSWSDMRGMARTGQERQVSFLQVPAANSALMAINEALRRRAWMSPQIWMIGEESPIDESPAPEKPSLEEVYLSNRVRPPEAVELSDFPSMEVSSDRMNVEMNSDGFLTICHGSYSYSGGAHGNYGSSYEVYSLRTGSLITLGQIIKPGVEKRWLDLGKKELLKQAGLPPTASLDEVGVWEQDFTELTDNWFLVPGGIGFCYNPYEVASYARGQVIFTLPWSDIEEDLLPDSPVAGLVTKYGVK